MGNVISHTLVGIVSALVMFALIGALAWYGVPRVVAWVVAGEQAKATVTALQQRLDDLQARDKAAADTAAKTCDGRVASAVQSAALIAKMTAPRPRAAGTAQTGVGNAAIRELVTGAAQ